MATVADVLAALERLAPARFTLPGDRVGLMVGDRRADVRKAVVALDISAAAVAYAKSVGAELLVTHHPLFFDPLRDVDAGTYGGGIVTSLVRSGIANVAAHTNWDAAKGGINDTLAERLGVRNAVPCGVAAMVERVKIVVYVPRGLTDALLDAMAAAGAGGIGNYRRCGFYADGTGTFQPLAGANPAIGTVGDVTSVSEVRLEMLTYPAQVDAVVAALRQAHPYEEPAYDLIPLRPETEMPLGRVGELPRPMSLREFAAHCDRALSTRTWTWGSERTVRRVAVCGGSASDEWGAAQRAGADVLVTGEVKQHHGLQAAESGFALLAAGHYATEHPGCETLAAKLAEALPPVIWETFEPAPGTGGRPW